MSQSRYEQRGVSASKSEVHEAIAHLDKGLFPQAFCKILPDYAANDPEFCNIMHADTAGTKTSLAYLYWRETGDLSVWKGIAQDAIVMNIDDMACAGCVNQIVLSSTIGRNKSIIPGEVIKEIIQGTQSFTDEMAQQGVQLILAGGETADVGDIVRTIDVGITAFGRIPRSQVVRNDISEGDIIIGLASYGQSTYEAAYNGGMGSNGLTSARHDVLVNQYAGFYPESFDDSIDSDLVYSGSKSLTDKIEIPGIGEIEIGKLILSPTRTYIPIIKVILDRYFDRVSGLIHCTGGAQTKVMKFVENKRIIKNNLFDPPPLFQLIEHESGTPRKEMYQVFNMGHRLEIYCDKKIAEDVIAIASNFRIGARVIGEVQNSASNELVIKDEKGTYVYGSNDQL